MPDTVIEPDPATKFATGLAQISELPTVPVVTFTVKEQVDIFPLASIAIYVTVVAPIGNAPPFVKPVVGLVVKDTEGVLQLSVAVGAVQEAEAVVPVVVKLIFVGQADKTGGVTSVVQLFVISETVTVKEQVDIFPLASIAI
jgi:hypothetical protein